MSACRRHGEDLPCWECSMERDEAERDQAEHEAVYSWKLARDEALAATTCSWNVDAPRLTSHGRPDPHGAGPCGRLKVAVLDDGTQWRALCSGHAAQALRNGWRRP